MTPTEWAYRRERALRRLAAASHLTRVALGEPIRTAEEFRIFAVASDCSNPRGFRKGCAQVLCDQRLSIYRHIGGIE